MMHGLNTTIQPIPKKNITLIFSLQLIDPFTSTSSLSPRDNILGTDVIKSKSTDRGFLWELLLSTGNNLAQFHTLFQGYPPLVLRSISSSFLSTTYSAVTIKLSSIRSVG